MVNKDVLEALELLTHKGFSNVISNNIITRKKQFGLLKEQSIKNKKVLLIDITGDIIFDIIKIKPLLIDYNLLNKFAKYYIDLKLVFISFNNYSKYTNFFVKSKDNNELLNYDEYYKIRAYLKEDSKLFWDALYENTNYNGMEIRNSDLFEQKYYEIYSYIKEIDYVKIKNNLKKIKINFINDINKNNYNEVIDFNLNL